ncbi:MAG: class I SAM-dependent methyltransferase [Desulfobacteraceae bacterium]|nr:MAG: class I SAM-dependent methyltransferase [Desulfobacteraceae bacterium]
MKIDAKGFEKLTKDIFAPVYPVLAENIIKDTGICRGVCIDLGAGLGSLGLELAKRAPGLQVILFDLSDEMLEIAERNCAETSLSERVKIQKGNVDQLPFHDGTADLIVSRGSIFFWENQAKTINEVYRVLKSGGCAYIGGGFGNADLLSRIKAKMKEKNPEWEHDVEKRIGEEGCMHFTKLMKATEVTEYEINRKYAGLWITFKK